MLLLIDAGNTRIKIGWLNPATGEREPAPVAAELNQLANLITALEAAFSGKGSPSAALGVSSAGQHTMHELDQRLSQAFGVQTHWAGSCRYAAGLYSRYDPPEQLGADRWAGMLGMMQHLRASKPDTTSNGTTAIAPVMLVSFGTATTIDTIYAAKGDTTPDFSSPLPSHARAVFAGGLILPGIQLMLHSLASGTARLPLANGATAAFPTHTHEAIMTGVLAAQTGAVLRQWHQCLERFGTAPRVVCTGGGWDAVHQELQAMLLQAQEHFHQSRCPALWSPNPVLDGLAHLAGHLPLPAKKRPESI